MMLLSLGLHVCSTKRGAKGPALLMGSMGPHRLDDWSWEGCVGCQDLSRSDADPLHIIIPDHLAVTAGALCLDPGAPPLFLCLTAGSSPHLLRFERLL